MSARQRMSLLSRYCLSFSFSLSLSLFHPTLVEIIASFTLLCSISLALGGDQSRRPEVRGRSPSRRLPVRAGPPPLHTSTAVRTHHTRVWLCASVPSHASSTSTWREAIQVPMSHIYSAVVAVAVFAVIPVPVPSLVLAPVYLPSLRLDLPHCPCVT